jgi:hypothetical protein
LTVGIGKTSELPQGYEIAFDIFHPGLDPAFFLGVSGGNYTDFRLSCN